MSGPFRHYSYRLQCSPVSGHLHSWLPHFTHISVQRSPPARTPPITPCKMVSSGCCCFLILSTCFIFSFRAFITTWQYCIDLFYYLFPQLGYKLRRARILLSSFLNPQCLKEHPTQSGSIELAKPMEGEIWIKYFIYFLGVFFLSSHKALLLPFLMAVFKIFLYFLIGKLAK